MGGVSFYVVMYFVTVCDVFFFLITFVTVCDVRFIIITVCDVWHESDLVIQRMPLEVWRVPFIWYLYCHVLASRSTMRVCRAFVS